MARRESSRLCRRISAWCSCWIGDAVALGAGAQGLDAEGEVVAQFRQQLDFRFVEGVGFGSVDAQRTDDLARDPQRVGEIGGVAVFCRQFAPQREAGVGADIVGDLRLAAADGAADRPLAALGVGPGEMELGRDSLPRHRPRPWA